jgi:hypothetical protein
MQDDCFRLVGLSERLIFFWMGRRLYLSSLGMVGEFVGVMWESLWIVVLAIVCLLL